MSESINAYRVLVGRPEGKRPLGRPRRRWEDNIKMDLREMGYDDRDWINLAQDRDQWRASVRAAVNLRALTKISHRPSQRRGDSGTFFVGLPSSPPQSKTPPVFSLQGYIRIIREGRTLDSWNRSRTQDVGVGLYISGIGVGIKIHEVGVGLKMSEWVSKFLKSESDSSFVESESNSRFLESESDSRFVESSRT
ncbi:hypothetical protein ANN_01813 [Periplaneta americana]|uniref:Uncharacterized protein n=1 Tax=Periplaneta americana TaxID=6978 RepID=A0ABQ8TUL3_PERAM|nr:hypothetical protein ANN_01813 [Periplaneta americana]